MKKRSIVRVLTVILTAALVLPCFAFAAGAAPDSDGSVTIKVGTYNIQNGQNPGVAHDFTEIAVDIFDAELDIVGLQEVDKNTTRNGNQDTMAIIAEELGYYYGYSRAIDLQGGEYGTGILSKYPILSYETIALPGPGEGRSLGHAVIDVDGVELDYYNTHLEWSSGEGRRNQLAYIKQIFSEKKLAILTGDLNTSTPEEYVPSFPLCNFANGLENVYKTNEDGAIDHIISTRNRVKQLKTGMIDEISNGHSDHNMLWAELKILPEDALRAEDGGFRWYEDGVSLTGWQKIGYDDLYFDPATGLMVSEDFDEYKFEEFAACGKTLYRTPLYIEKIITYPYITNARGADVTEKLTDGSVGTYIDGDDQSHWYFQPEGPLWTIQNGVLVIGGIGTYEGGDLGRFNDEIDTIVVAPQDPTIKYGGDFGVKTGVVLEAIASGAFAGLTNVKKAYIPDNVTLADDAFDAGAQVTLYRTAAKALTVAPATGYGIVNEDGKTLLKLSVKDGDEDLTLDGTQKIVVVYTDGEKNNEAGSFFCSALKYSEIQPTYADGVFTFDICAPVGPDQFIPVRQATYIANVYVLNADGSIAAQGSSKQFAIRCSDHPVVTERTADYTYLSSDNYVTVDLGKEKEIDKVSVAFINSSDRYYFWQLYGTNDPTLPLCKWDFLGEKMTQETSNTGAYTIDVGGASYRYLRPYALYASNRWTALFAEVTVKTNDISNEWTSDENEHWHCFIDSDEEAPGTRAPHTASAWIIDTMPAGTVPGEQHKECTVCGRILETAEITAKTVKVPFTVTTAYGDDVTDILTDGDQDTYVDGDSHWYFPPKGPIWTVQNGVLVIGGTGVLTNEGFARFNDEIRTIFVAPQDPTYKFG
ncbi:MAG: endonuclease/exonuclease/phosphatase family protein, partial [Clostridia bacterium]|nr:endonuclease/exonuclease/phosphatase family protein [Clostridia bacterium]